MPGKHKSDFGKFPVVPASFTGLVLSPGVTMPSLLCLHYISGAAQSLTEEEISATPGRAAALKNKSHLGVHICNAQYVTGVLKYQHDEMLSSKCAKVVQQPWCYGCAERMEGSFRPAEGLACEITHVPDACCAS